QQFNLDRLGTNLLDIVRGEFNLNINSKELDLGLGNRLNLGGTGYTQRFYQTQDAQYSVTGQVSYSNNFLEFLVPRLSYKKVITDQENNTPFSFDRLARNKQDILNGSLNFGNIPEF